MPGPDLTARELEVLQAAAAGETHADTARRLYLHPKSLEKILTRVFRKLGARNAPHAVFLACRAGLLDGRPQRHGDHAGYAAHIYRGETPCDDCEAGEKAYKAAWRKQRKTRQREAA